MDKTLSKRRWYLPCAIKRALRNCVTSSLANSRSYDSGSQA